MGRKLENLIPRDKHDFENVDAIITLGYPAISPIIPQRLEWIQDMNWPIAQKLAPFFSSIGKPILPEIKKILNTTDGIWKYWCLSEGVGKMPDDVIATIKPELIQLLEKPTKDEIPEEVNLIAHELLDRIEM
ncbi:MAG: hypothetical protein IEMM0008_1640 [bacterium]|nr:MAG: hypothetical protein IEMM0008_1640 [bacterium]